MTSNNKVKVVHMVTTSSSLILMRGQLSYLKNCGFDVSVIASPGEELDNAKIEENVNIKPIYMERALSPLKDLISLLTILLYFLRTKPDICNSGTPKAGLLGMIAAWLTRVPLKVYTIRGLPFEGATGLKKTILILSEKIACAFADKIICISPSIEKKALEFSLAPKNKTVVFGEGSSNGLQLDKFKHSQEIQKKIEIIKKEHDLNGYDFIIGYVGRINNFKGIKELVEAFEELMEKYNNIALVLVGPKEKKDSILDETNSKIINNSQIIEIGHVKDPVPYYYLMDVLAFPTYREGFGNVSIEAQATGTPVVTTNATGAIDTVVNNETGFVVNVADVVSLEQALEKFIKNPNLIQEMGEKGKQRAERKFDSTIIWSSIESLYKAEPYYKMISRK